MAARPQQPEGPAGARAVCILGLGAVGRTLANELARAGVPVSAWSRSLAHAADASRAPRAPYPSSGSPGVRASADLAEALRGARALVFCVRDAAIAELAERVAPLLEGEAPAVALHTSGFLGAEPLAPLARRGLATGVMHPLTALPRATGAVDDVPRLRGVWFATSGAPAARALARELVAALGGHELALTDVDGAAGAQAAYHAAATLLSNGLVALFDAALAVAGTASADPRALHAAFAGLLAATCDNLRRAEPAAAMTGPIARGDVEVVRGHLARLASLPDGSALALYRLLGLRLVALARAGPADPARLSELERLLAR